MKSYGMRGDMNPQTKQKGEMSPSKGNVKSKKSDKYPGKGKGSHDMSPKVVVSKDEAVWQNMR